MAYSLFYSFADLDDPMSSLYQLQPPARLALIGTPVAQSRSPEIHNERIKKQSLPWRYIAIDVHPAELPRAFDLLQKNHFLGFNVTMPHKQAAVALVDEITDHARLLGAINTVVIRDEKKIGHNTDGPGFVAALEEEWNFSLKGRSLLILGATGGAGRALAMQSAMEDCRQLFLSSRTPTILDQQVQQLLQIRPDLLVEAVGLDEASLKRAMSQVDLIVNATPLGFLGQEAPSLIPSKFFQSRHYAYDIISSTKPTPLMQAASQAGARSADGSAMTRLQGAMAFEIWLHQNGGAPIDAAEPILL
ncbi:MAG: shikimate dehydrogenase [Verrucomicrobia bacterium]|nr:shikimate dehydrogenase [Verrucomicrobiota bacterium]